MPNRFRAAKACQTCHQRRIKCDAIIAGPPCSNCRQLNLSDTCVLIKSKRGTYDRKARLQSKDNAAKQKATGPEQPVQEHDPLVTEGDVIGPEEQTGDLSDGPHRETNQAIDTIQNRHLVNTPTNTSTSTGTPSSSNTDVSWATLFDHFLDSAHHKLQKGSIAYLGEPFPLSIILEDLKDHGRLRLHYPIGAQAFPSQELPAQTHQQHPSHIPAELVQFLETNGSFSIPAKEVTDRLLETFFQHVYPFYPILNRKEFMHSYELRETPWILLQAVFFAAVTFGPGSLIHAAGFSERKQARTVFYNRARWLFDFGYERNKVVVLQSVVLLTLWGGTPHDFWNFYSRIGTAVTIAESLGIHRTTAGTNMPQKDKSLLKRLWWVLVSRDAFCAVLFGRPLRINMAQCDVEIPTPEDFVVLPGENKGSDLHGLFNIELSKLAIILRDTMLLRFRPRQVKEHNEDETTISSLRQELQDWRRNLNPLLDWQNMPAGSNIYASSLSLVHDCHLILIHLRPPSAQVHPMSPLQPSPDESFSLRVVQEAAQRIALLGSVLMTKNMMTIMPHDPIVAFFPAEVVFYSQMRSPDQSVVQMARLQLNICQMIMHEIRDFWDSAPWIVQLFSNLASKAESSPREMDITALNPGMGSIGGGDINGRSTRTDVTGNDDGNYRRNNSDVVGNGNSGISLNAWPEHPVFSNFVPPDPGSLGDLTDFSLFTSNGAQFGDWIPPQERYPFVAPYSMDIP